ncbi:MAG: hypothetical protein ACM31C_11655 [Acidobacteriota bacterium]
MRRLGLLGCVLASAGVAHADRVASTGFFAEGGLGAVSFLPATSSDAAVGPAMNLRVGRDLFSFLSLGVYIAASSHEATTPPPPEGQWFQLYRGGADARIGGRFDSIAAFVEGGLGGSMISSNVLEKVMITKPGSHYSLTIHGGGGFEYQLENRHYALGAAVDFFLEPQFKNMKALESRLYLRYTYGGG